MNGRGDKEKRSYFFFVLTMWDVKGDRFQFEKAYNVIYYIVFLRSSILLLCFHVITFPFSEEVKNKPGKKKEFHFAFERSCHTFVFM